MVEICIDFSLWLLLQDLKEQRARKKIELTTSGEGQESYHKDLCVEAKWVWEPNADVYDSRQNQDLHAKELGQRGSVRVPEPA